jgi:hypothetical protein
MSRRGTQRSVPGTARYVPSWVDEPLETGTVGGSTRAQAAASLALRYGLWGGLILAVLLGVINTASFATGSDSPPPAPAAETEAVAPPGGCAEVVVAAWLAGDQELLDGVTGITGRAPAPDLRRAVHTYTASATGGEQGWAYLVGAEVQVRQEGQSWRPAGLQFFAVTMLPTGGGCAGWAPAALPAQVAAPQLASPPLPYPETLPVSGTGLSETLTAFFTGMLTGTGNPERYLAPGTTVAFPAPPPYREVTLDELRAPADAPVDRGSQTPADGTVVPLLATVGTGPDSLPLVYPVTAGVRDGRWEVLALDPLVEGG